MEGATAVVPSFCTTGASTADAYSSRVLRAVL